MVRSFRILKALVFLKIDFVQDAKTTDTATENKDVEMKEPQGNYDPVTMKDENGKYPGWMNKKAILRFKGKPTKRKYKQVRNKPNAQ